MPNGERIQFGTNVNFIFETDNLRFATPATISLGMVRNVLGHMVPGQKKDIGEDEEFVIAKTDFFLVVCRGFAGNLPPDLRHNLVREVCKWAGESLTCSKNPLNLQLSDGSSCATRTASEGPMWRFRR